LLLVFAFPLNAQQSDLEWLTVYAEHVQISDQQAYEEANRGLISMFSDAGISDVSWVAVQSQRFGYAYVFQGTGPGELAEFNATWGSVMATLGDRGLKAMAKSEAFVSSRDMNFIALRPDLSYMPDNVQITADMPYRHYTQLFVHPAKVSEFEATMPLWRSAYSDAGIEDGWRVYQYMTGSDLPAYLIVQAADSEAAFHARQAENEVDLGDKVQDLRAKTGPTLRRVEESGGWVRADLSYAGGY